MLNRATLMAAAAALAMSGTAYADSSIDHLRSGPDATPSTTTPIQLTDVEMDNVTAAGSKNAAKVTANLDNAFLRSNGRSKAKFKNPNYIPPPPQQCTTHRRCHRPSGRFPRRSFLRTAGDA